MWAPRAQESECWELLDINQNLAAISSGLGIEFLLCARGGEQFGGKEVAPKCPENLYEDEEPTGEDLVDYVGYLDRVEYLIVTEPTEVAEEPMSKVSKENGGSHSHIKVADEKGQCGTCSKAVQERI